MIIFALPAYNESASIEPLLDTIASAMTRARMSYRVFLVNDGSTDATLAKASRFLDRMPLTIVNHAQNMGLGAALSTGLHTAVDSANPGDIVVTMDADNSHDPSLVPMMAKTIEQGADVVVASRFTSGGQEVGVALHRRILSHSAGAILRRCFPTGGVRDYTCGYRAYRVETLQKAFAIYGDNLVEERGFSCMVEVLLKLRRLGATFKEVPLVLRYDLKRSSSKIRVVKTVMRYFVLIARSMKPLPEPSK